MTKRSANTAADSGQMLRRNVLANFAGRGWLALMNLLFVPVYIRYLGPEAYGLIGLFASLWAVLSLLDLGLSATLNRELARMSADDRAGRAARDLVRTLELIYWGTGAVIGAGVLLAAPLAARWVNTERLPASAVRQSLLLMGMVMALSWPFALYSGGLLGLQRQVLLNGINIGVATVRGVGAVLVLALVSPTVQAFFGWQLLVAALRTVLTGRALWRSLPSVGERARFRRTHLNRIWRFAVGLSGIAVLSVILTQLDKLVLSRLLSLEMFGYYALAAVVAASLECVVSPLFAAMFPRFSRLVATGDRHELARLYHRACQLMALLVLPVAVMVSLFSEELLRIWTRDAVTVAHTHRLVSLLIAGSALNALVNLPYALQLAHGWTTLALWQNVVAVVLLVPLLIGASLRYGGTGAAVVWIVLNGGYVLFGVPVMHTRLLPGEQWRWYGQDVAMPLAAALAVILPARLAFPAQLGAPAAVGLLGLILLLGVAAAGVVTPLGAGMAAALWRQRFPARRASLPGGVEVPAAPPSAPLS